MSIGKVAKCHIAMGAWIVIRKKARACPGRGFIPWASGGQPRHHITSLLLNVPGLFNHHLPHLLEIGVRKGSLCICHPGSRLICRSHRDEACAAGWQGVDRMWTCGNNKASTFLWRLCFVWCGTRSRIGTLLIENKSKFLVKKLSLPPFVSSDTSETDGFGLVVTLLFRIFANRVSAFSAR